MIKIENITINGKEYIRTWSDDNKMIERDEKLYEEAIDPIDSGRTYTETEQDIDRELSDKEALEILTGGVYGNEVV